VLPGRRRPRVRTWKGGWPACRGPGRTGSAPAGNPPIEWFEEKNVRWKKAVPSLDLCSPIVWGDRLFLTIVVPTGERVANPAAGRQVRVDLIDGFAVEPSAAHRLVMASGETDQ